MSNNTTCRKCGRLNPTKHCQTCSDRDTLNREAKEPSKPVLNRYKDGSLAIQSCPEIFLCSRNSIEMMVAGNDARSEIKRLEAELAKASRIQQTVTIAEQTIKDQSATIERLTHQHDKVQTLAGELIAAIRINTMRGTFATATHEQVEEWLQPFIQRLNTTKP